jgi:hypothetical protein
VADVVDSTAIDMRGGSAPPLRSNADGDRRPIRAGRWPGVFAWAAYAVIAVVAYWPAWIHGLNTHLEYSGGDISIYTWSLSTTAHSLEHGQNLFYSNYLNYPGGTNMLNNTTVLLLGIIMTPVTLIFGAVASFNVLMTLAFILSAGAAYFVLRRWTSWWPAAFAGGLLYGFSPYMIGYGRGGLFLLFVPLPPLILLCLYELLVRQAGHPIRWGITLAVLVIAQFFISSELLADTAELAAGGLLILCVAKRRQVVPKFRWAWKGIAPGGALCAVVLAYPAWYLLRGPEHVNLIAPAQLYSNDLLGPLVPTSNELISTPGLRHLGNTFAGGAGALPGGQIVSITNGAYLGITLLLLLAVIVIRYRRVAMVQFFTLMAVATFVISLGPVLQIHDHAYGLDLPAKIFGHLPLLKATFPNRFSVFVSLFAAAVLAIGLDRIRVEMSGRSRSSAFANAVPVALGIVALLPLVPKLPYSEQPVPIPSYITSKAVDSIPSGSVVLSYPFPTPFAGVTMLWQERAGMRYRIVGGYMFVQGPNGTVVGSDDPGTAQTLLQRLYLGPNVPKITPAQVLEISQEMKQWGISTVLVQTAAPRSSTAIKWFTFIIGRAPHYSGGMAVWHEVHV